MAKIRVPFMAPQLLLSTGVSKDINIPLSEFIWAASGAGYTASIAAYKLGNSSAIGLNFINTSPASVLGFIIPLPQDIALSGTAAGSGTVYVDWTTTVTKDLNAQIAACVIWIPSGCTLLTPGGCQLGAGCALLAQSAASELTSSSLMQFKVPPNRNAMLKVLFRRCAGDPKDTAQAEFVLLNFRLRYKADRIGS